MTTKVPQAKETALLDVQQFQHLLDLLKRTHRVVGPTVRDGAILYDDIASTSDLPIGWTDEQSGGSYRLKRRGDGALFGYVVGPHSWKRLFQPPAVKLWRAVRKNGSFSVEQERQEVRRTALIGVRACELSAFAILDHVFSSGQFADPAYKARRRNTFIVAVNCGQAGGTCFCASMNTGPKAASGYDIALTEVVEGGRHFFVAESGSPQGAKYLADVPHAQAGQPEVAMAEALSAKAAGQMGRHLDMTGVKELLYNSYEDPHWGVVGDRCLTCGNCTLVCPTCTCNTIEDVTDLAGRVSERWRKWDSCFTTGFSYVHGGSVRPSAYSRYRQWLTHKLSASIDQFQTPGCVGCGRCITWCPVGIDLTEEVRALRSSVASKAAPLPAREGTHAAD